jgi:hypothetical protein
MEGVGYKQLTGSALIAPVGVASRLLGYEVVVATAVGPINVREGSVSGTIVMVIPSGTAAGARANLATPINIPGGIFVEYNSSATGTVNFLVS